MLALALRLLSLLLTRNEVRVEFDVLVPVSSDNTQRWGYVWLDRQLVNEEMLRSGNAVLVTRVPNVKHVERLRLAQKEAREKLMEVLKSENKEERKEKIAELHKANHDRLHNLLTEEQRTKWHELAGPPFKGEIVFEEAEQDKPDK